MCETVLEWCGVDSGLVGCLGSYLLHRGQRVCRCGFEDFTYNSPTKNNNSMTPRMVYAHTYTHTF